jgi:hypothetical protein
MSASGEAVAQNQRNSAYDKKKTEQIETALES